MRLNASLLALAALLTLTACPKRVVIVDGEEKDIAVAADDELAPGLEAWKKGMYEDAVMLIRGYLEKYGEEDRSDLAHHAMAQSLMALDRGEEAAEHHLAILQFHPLSPYADTARLYVGISHVENGEWNDAVQVLTPAFENLEGEDRLAAARALSDAAVGLEDWPGAVRWLAEVRDMSEDSAAIAAVDEELLRLVDEVLPPIALETLRQELPEDSPAWPLVVMKLARLFYHLRDYGRAYELVGVYLDRAPDGAFAELARTMATQLEQLAQVKPGVIGVILPQSGKYAGFGKAVLDGIGMAMKLAPAEVAAVKLVIKDTKGDAEETAKAVESLVLEHQAVAIIGPLLKSPAEAAAAKAEELGVPLISISRTEGLAEQGPWVFQNALTDAAQMQALVDYAVDVLHAKAAGIVYPGHTYGERMMAHFWTAAEKRQLEVRAVQKYAHDETTFAGTIKPLVGRYHLNYRREYEEAKRHCNDEIDDPYKKRKCLERARDDLEPIVDFDVLFVPDSYRNVGLIAPALAFEDVITNVCDRRDLKRIQETTGKDELPTVRLMGTNAWNHPDLPDRGEKYVRCSIFVDGFFKDSTRTETKAFVDAFVAEYGKGAEPVYLNALGYDTAGIVRAIVEKENPPSRGAFREALLRVRDFPGVTGATSFSATGEVEKPLFFLTVTREHGQNKIAEVPPEGGASD